MNLHSSATKPVYSEMQNQTQPTTLSFSTGQIILDAAAQTLLLPRVKGYIREDILKGQPFDTGEIQEAYDLSAHTFSGIFLGGFDKDAKFQWIEKGSIIGGDVVAIQMPNTQYVQMIEAVWLNGRVESIKNVYNCIIDTDTATILDELTTALGKLSDTKLIASIEHPRRFTLKGEFQPEQREDSYFARTFQRSVNFFNRTSTAIHASTLDKDPEYKLVKSSSNRASEDFAKGRYVDEFFVSRYLTGEIDSHFYSRTEAQSQILPLYINGTEQDIDHMPRGVIPVGKWTIINVTTKQEVGQERSDVHVWYGDTLYESFTEAWNHWQVFRLPHDFYREGVVFICGGCLSLTESRSRVYSTDKFGTQLDRGSNITDAEREAELSTSAFDINDVLTEDGEMVIELGNLLVNK